GRLRDRTARGDSGPSRPARAPRRPGHPGLVRHRGQRQSVAHTRLLVRRERHLGCFCADPLRLLLVPGRSAARRGVPGAASGASGRAGGRRVTVMLVRHGESEGNAGRIIQGSLNTMLTDLGRRQAAAVAARLASQPLAAVYGTPLQRAMDTAQAIAGAHGLEVATVEDLSERVFGEAQGLTWEEASARWNAVAG